MKCDIVFHPATTTMSRCRNMPFVKRWWQDITCAADGGARTSRHQTSPNNTWMTLENRASIPSIDLLFDHERKRQPPPPAPHPPLPHVVWPQTHRTTQFRWETQEATLSNIVHWDMFLLLQVWRQSCARTQSMFYGEGF